MTPPRVAIVGAGIGGLVTAVALNRAGIDCAVFERAATRSTAGAGIQLSPNATRLLTRLGIDAVGAGAVRPVRREIRSWADGALIGQVALGALAEARYGAPYCTLLRSDLSDRLSATVRGVCGVGTVRFGHDLVGLTPHSDGVTLEFADGTRHRADAVIGADGLNSVVRRHIADDPVRFSGHVAHRALVPTDRVPWLAGPCRVVVWLGPGQHCVCYPVDGGRTVNVVATTPAGRPPAPGATTSRDALLSAYRGWNAEVTGLLAAAACIEPHGLFDRAWAPHRYRGRVAVVGDAAHPMLPFLAQGAAMAIEDAVSVAASLRDTGGFAAYEARRRPRTDRLAAALRGSARTYHLPDGPRQRERDAALAAGGLDAHDWLYGATHGDGTDSPL